jgi:hypothetical protein
LRTLWKPLTEPGYYPLSRVRSLSLPKAACAVFRGMLCPAVLQLSLPFLRKVELNLPISTMGLKLILREIRIIIS